jgi:glycosyltransferase involved in cell wall biosynthesis
MPLPKVLVATTIYEGKDYIMDRFYKNICSLDYPNYEILLVDNSETNEYKKQLVQRGYKNVVHVARGKHSREGVANALNYIRKYALQNGYDYWLSIECDLIPPKDIIQRLMLHQKTIVGCIYVIGYKDSNGQPPRPCLFGLRRRQNGELETFNYNPKEGFAFFGGGVQRIHGCGLGCTLVKAELLRKLEFWYMDDEIKHSDVYMYMDLHNMGHDVWLDSDIIIPHYNSKWDLVKDI